MRRQSQRAPGVRFGWAIAAVGLLPFLAACAEVKKDEVDPRCFEPEPGTIVEDVYYDKFGPPPPPICPPKPIIVPELPTADDPSSPPDNPPDNPPEPPSKEPISFERPGGPGDFNEENQPGFNEIRDREQGSFQRPGG